MPLDGNQPGRVSPYARPACAALYVGDLAPGVVLRCGRLKHDGKLFYDQYHAASLPPLPGREEPRAVTWL